jgi:hypothetical protein
MRPDIAPGGTFPDYELPDHTRGLAAVRIYDDRPAGQPARH